MIVVVIMALVKTFFFLRIYDLLSPIVTMLTTVIIDLKIFMFFFMILIALFSLIMGILGLGNWNVEGKFRDKYFTYRDVAYPGNEYEHTGLLLGNFLMTFRIALGDFTFSASTYLNK